MQYKVGDWVKKRITRFASDRAMMPYEDYFIGQVVGLNSHDVVNVVWQETDELEAVQVERITPHFLPVRPSEPMATLCPEVGTTTF